MDTSAIVVALIALAIVAANLPFFNQRVFAVVPLAFASTHGRKPLWVRLLELIALYFVIGGIARAIESNIGSIYPQGWEFYAVTVCLFIVAAYPGYVWRYLRRASRG